MRSIRGSTKAWFNLKNKKKSGGKQPKKKNHKCYEVTRKRDLAFIGYESYSVYLKSSEWKTIRDKTLSENPLCVLCRKRAYQVHHLSYDPVTLVGGHPNRLVSVCRGCHEHIEFDRAGDKATLFKANVRLFTFAWNYGGCSKEWAREVLAHRWFKSIRKRLINSGVMSNKTAPAIKD